METLRRGGMIKKAATDIAVVPAIWKKFLMDVFDNLTDKQREEWYRLTARLMFPESRWWKMEQWMEQRYIKNMQIKPRKMTSMCMYYLKIRQDMRPKILKLAQKVKLRLAERNKYVPITR